jgi:hypothetical protein
MNVYEAMAIVCMWEKKMSEISVKYQASTIGEFPTSLIMDERMDQVVNIVFRDEYRNASLVWYIHSRDLWEMDHVAFAERLREEAEKAFVFSPSETAIAGGIADMRMLIEKTGSQPLMAAMDKLEAAHDCMIETLKQEGFAGSW